MSSRSTRRWFAPIAIAGIAESTAISLARIERLNPHVDAEALHAGQQIKHEP